MHIKEFLKKLPVSKLKDLARRHNAVYRIKIGQSRDGLIEDLTRIYKHYTGTHIVSNPEKLLVDKIKLTVTKKQKTVEKPIEKPKLLTYNELTKEQKQQANTLIKQRDVRKKENEQMQKEMLGDLKKIQEQPKIENNATNKALQTLINMGLINDKELQKMGIVKFPSA